MSENPDFNMAVLSFNQLEDKLLLARENIDFALQQELSIPERRRLTNMSNMLRSMTATFRSAR